MSELKRYLQFKIDALDHFGMTDPRYNVVEKFLLEHGTFSYGRPLPKGYRYRKVKNCFQNAYQLASNKNLTYCEGFAFRHNLPLAFEHAWVVDDEGGIIDVTWRDVTNTDEYLGMAFTQYQLDRIQLKTKHYSVFWGNPIGITNFDLIEKLKNKEPV